MYALTNMESSSGHEELTPFNKCKIIINNPCWEFFYENCENIVQ